MIVKENQATLMVLKTSCKMFSTYPPQYHPPLLAINRQEDAGEVLVHIAGTSPLVQAGPYRQLTLCIVGGAGTRLLKVKMRMVTILMMLTAGRHKLRSFLAASSTQNYFLIARMLRFL